MNVEDLERFRSKAAERRDRKIAAAQEEYDRAILGINEIYTLDRDSFAEPSPAIEKKAGGPMHPTGDNRTKAANDLFLQLSPPTQTDNAREAIAGLAQDHFMMRDLVLWHANTHPNRKVTPAHMSAALNKLAENGEVEIYRRGTGKSNPSLFRATQKLRKVSP